MQGNAAIVQSAPCQSSHKVGLAIDSVGGMNAESRPVGPKARKALERVIAANAAMRDAETVRKMESQKRALAIAKARAHGMSLDAIAQQLDVSRERVRQMAAMAADPVRSDDEGPGRSPN
jgi:DNA-binding NarL/FixJ family response regulator